MSATAAPSAISSPSVWPALSQGLEEVWAGQVRDMAGAFVFSLSRLAAKDTRPVLVAAGRAWRAEQGRPYGPGLGNAGLRETRLILVEGRTEADLLWTMEQALRSGAVSAVVGTVETASLAQTRRLEFAARDGEASAILLRQTQGGLNAARRRWRVTTLESIPDPADPRAPGGYRLKAELTRSRTERPGIWIVEQDDETHRLRLADRLAGDGLASITRRRAA
ncbi:hypothetical protein BH10PSE2_BH10PSE2_22490 [soil metagenome]